MYNMIDNEIDDFESEFDGLENLMTEIKILSDVSLAIESFGINPTAVGIMKATGLLVGTSLETLATESFGISKSDDPESKMALESIGEKISEKFAKYAAKILEVAKNFADKVKSLLTPIWNKIEEKVKSLSSAAWDKTKELGKTIKAHPYKTLVALAGAAVAVGSVVALVASQMPSEYANESALTGFIYKFEDSIKKIRFPFGKIVTTVTDNGKQISCTIEKVTNQDIVKEGHVFDMGYTKTAINALYNLLKKSFVVITTGVIKTGLVFINTVSKMANISTKIGYFVERKTGSGIIGGASSTLSYYVMWYSIVKVIRILYSLIKNIVLKAYEVISSTLSNVLHGLPKEASA